MSSDYVWIWIKIRRLDFQFETNSPDVPESLQKVLLPRCKEFEELKSIVYSWPGLRDDSKKVVKVRRHDRVMIPLSALYKGSTKEQPFILEVVNFYQSSIQKRQTEKKPDDLEEAFHHKLDILDKRLGYLELREEETLSSTEQKVAESAKKLSETVEFLNRRIDEMAPEDWKDQINKPSTSGL